MKSIKKSRRTEPVFEQIGFSDIKLHIGDKLYKNGELYAEVKGESEELYFLQKTGSSCDIPTPYLKTTIIDRILFGTFCIEHLNFQ